MNVAGNHRISQGTGSGGSIYGGNLLFGGMGLKSTREKLERQQKMTSEVEFWEQQKEHLKERECESVEEMADKLEALHTYEDEISAARMAYNLEQMHHVLDEAQEMGEQIADAAEDLEPKTPEERREEEAGEAAGIEEEGMLSEMLSDTEMLEESQEMLPDTGILEDSARMLEEEVPYIPIDIRV